MSGSSLDGIDIIAATFNSNRFHIVSSATVELPSDLKEKLALSTKLDLSSFFSLESEYSTFLATELDLFIKKNELKEITNISIHGHTAFHEPQKGFSYQMVSGGLIASKLNQDIIVDFRTQDIGKGGQGAPLAPIVEHLFPNVRAFCNLGGIANISIHQKHILGYDVSPCNQLLNHFAQSLGVAYDKNGEFGRTGKIQTQLLHNWLAQPYFSAPHPKSIDNSWVKSVFLNQSNDVHPVDLLATSYEFISRIIANEFGRHLKTHDQIMFTGGGAHNTFLMTKIEEKLNSLGLAVYLPEQIIIDFKEALLMAYMGHLNHQQTRYTLPSTTGANESVIAGALYKGK